MPRALLRFGVQRGAGVLVARTAAEVPVAAGESFRLRVPPWPRWFPARIVWVIDTPDVVGFGYGTLPGHAESGEEAFVLERRSDGSIWFTVRAFSRPRTHWWRALSDQN